jgi:hypothetical protein
MVTHPGGAFTVTRVTASPSQSAQPEDPGSEDPMRSDIVPGGTFPDYELSDHTGRRRALSALQGSDPMILVLARGSFCPKDRRQLRNLVDLWPETRS